MIEPLLCPVHALHRRGPRTQQQQALFLHTAVFCHLSGVIFRYIFRLIGGLLFLVQNDKLEPGQRSEYRRAGANDYPGFPRADPLPFVVSLTRPQRGVEHPDLVAKMGRKQPQQLRRQSDFWHHHQRGPAPLQHPADQLQIHLGLSAAGDAIEQRRRRLAGADQLVQTLIGPLLLLVQLGLAFWLHTLRQSHPAKDLPLFQSKNAPLGQTPQGGAGGSGKVTQLLC